MNLPGKVPPSRLPMAAVAFRSAGFSSSTNDYEYDADTRFRLSKDIRFQDALPQGQSTPFDCALQ